MDESDYSGSLSIEERKETQLKDAGQRRANGWANTCHALKLFFFLMTLVYFIALCNTVKDSGLSWQVLPGI